MLDHPAAFVVHGTLIHTPVLGEIEVLVNALVSVDDHGTISSVLRADASRHQEILAAARGNSTLIELQDGQYLLPGLVDLHIHAPQWPQMGKALHLPLDEWLQRCTFPLEAKYDDLEFAGKSYESLVDNLLANGTTTATYFGTVQVAATKLLADTALRKGQRAVIGKVAMDNEDQCPDFYRDPSSISGLDGTRELIEYVRGLSGNESALVMPAVTPRFIPSCTDEMLDGLATIAREYDCHVQTHCSESDWEHAYVQDRHGVNDTQSLDRIGLLTDKTILAHSNLIDDQDMATIKSSASAIAHCPLSNLYFSHSVFPARKALDSGLKLGLGTDISGGPSPSILHNCQAAVNVSRALEDGVDPALPAKERGAPGSRIDFREAFWMATAGGAKALGLNVGQFGEACAFDALLIDTSIPDSNLRIWDGVDTPDDILQKIIYNAGRRNITKVWVQGRLVKDC
jgi:guanine deaminase